MNPRHEQAQRGRRHIEAARKYWQPQTAPAPESVRIEIVAQRGLQSPLRACQADTSPSRLLQAGGTAGRADQ